MSRSARYRYHRTSTLHSPRRSEPAPSCHGGPRPASARPPAAGVCRIEPPGWLCSLCCMLALLLAAPLLAAPPAAPPTMVLQVGHSGDISAFAYSPDGQTLATRGDRGAQSRLQPPLRLHSPVLPCLLHRWQDAGGRG